MTADKIRPTFAAMARTPHQWIALSGGLGLSPIGPGTLGALGGIALFVVLSPLDPLVRAASYCAMFALGVWAAQKTGEDLGEHDHNAIVFDETFAMLLILETVAPSLLHFAVAFVLFRAFDTQKPWPVNIIDRFGKGGFAVMFDDVAAAFYTIAAMAVLMLIWPL